ncbi:MAG: Cna B-type domain-containing protein, partial [Kiritimatiellia bacterium]
YTFKAPKFDTGGKKIGYSISEEPVQGYVTTIESNGTDITNTRTGLIDVEVKKVWADGVDEADKVPVTMKLQVPDGVTLPEGATDTVVLNVDNKWTHTFKELQRFDKVSGKPYTYNVTETAIDGVEVKGNKATVTVNGIPVVYTVSGTETTTTVSEDDVATQTVTVTNTAARQVGTLAITKVLKDATAEAGETFTFSIPVPKGYQADASGVEGAAVDGAVLTIPVKISKAGGGTATVTVKNLPVGAYTVTETGVPGGKTYTTKVDEAEKSSASVTIAKDQQAALTITNTRTGVTELTVKKQWVDGKDKDGYRTDVTVKLTAKAKGEEIPWDKLGPESPQVQTVRAMKPTLKLEKLPAYDGEGNPITYSVQELGKDKNPVAEGGVAQIGNARYKVAYATDKDTVTITNTRLTDVEFTKKWVDAGGDRPGLTFVLYADDKATEDQTPVVEKTTVNETTYKY